MARDQTSFLVFSDDWGEHPSSCQHIFRHIVRDYPVVWVNTVGMRLPRLNKTDMVKGLKKLARMFWGPKAAGASKVLPAGLSVLQPFMLPYNKGPWRAFNRRSVIKAVHKELRRRQLVSPILVTTVPNACDYIGAFGERRVVYYCVDDFAEWPGHEKDLVLEMERDLVTKADIFIATSEKLVQRLRSLGKPTHFLPHGVDCRAFEDIPEGREHPALAPIPRPRVGYVGLIDARLNWRLIEYLLQRLPEVSFVFVGRVEIELALEHYANFYHVPPVPYTEVPLVLKSLDLLVLPYEVNSFTQTINPLKLKEYLASGRGIVGAPLQEIERFADYLIVARDLEEWLVRIRDFLFGGVLGPEGDRRSLLLSEDWSFKARQFLDICLKG